MAIVLYPTLSASPFHALPLAFYQTCLQLLSMLLAAATVARVLLVHLPPTQRVRSVLSLLSAHISLMRIMKSWYVPSQFLSMGDSNHQCALLAMASVCPMWPVLEERHSQQREHM